MFCLGGQDLRPARIQPSHTSILDMNALLVVFVVVVVCHLISFNILEALTQYVCKFSVKENKFDV